MPHSHARSTIRGFDGNGGTGSRRSSQRGAITTVADAAVETVEDLSKAVSDFQRSEYTVPDGTGLNVWRGPAAAQPLEGSGFHLPGGGQQIWMPPNTVTPGPAMPTGW